MVNEKKGPCDTAVFKTRKQLAGIIKSPRGRIWQPYYPPDASDAFEPDARENLIQVMQEVKDFYLRNSDGSFHLDAVITPPVTIPLPKWEENGTQPLTVEIDYDDLEIGLIEPPLFNRRPKFRILRLLWTCLSRSSFHDLSPFGNFEKTPLVTIEGELGSYRTARSRIRTRPSRGFVNASGQITQIVITEPERFIMGPTLYLNNDRVSIPITFTMGRTVTWAAVTTCGSGGLGVVGGAGTHVNHRQPRESWDTKSATTSACGMRIVMSRTCLRQRVTKARGLIMKPIFTYGWRRNQRNLTISQSLSQGRRPFRIKRWDRSEQRGWRGPPFGCGQRRVKRAQQANGSQTPTLFEFIDTTMVRLPIRFERAASTW